jgi:hypothetical protein
VLLLTDTLVISQRILSAAAAFGTCCRIGDVERIEALPAGAEPAYQDGLLTPFSRRSAIHRRNTGG